MCLDPITISGVTIGVATQLAAASAAVSTLSAVATYAQQSKSASGQSAATQSAYDSSVSQARNQQVETAQASGAQQSERARQALIETGHLQALANESGTAGGSDDRVTNEANFNAGTDIASIQANTESSQRQIIGSLNGSYAQAQQRSASIVNPSLIGTGLQIAGGALSAETNLKYAGSRASGGVPAVQTTQ